MFSFSLGSPGQVVNQVLFEINQEVWTSYDLKQFLKAKNQVQLNPDLVKLAATDLDLFVMTRLLLRQIVGSMNSAELVKYNIIAKYKDSNESLSAEIHRLNTISESDDARYKQLVSKDKYEMWMNYMKKKYNFISQ